MKLPTTQYDVVVVDFPWFYPSVSPTVKRVNSAARHYPLMKDEEVLQFPLESLIKPNGVIFMWATCPRLDIAMQVGLQRNLLYSGMPFVWLKTRQSDGAILGAAGMRPRIVKPVAEVVLGWTRQKAIISPSDFTIRQAILAPRREHSRKPDEFYRRVERLYPHASRLDVFSRETRVGWDSWGNEVGKYNDGA